MFSVFMIYLSTKFDIPTSNGLFSPLTKTKENFHTADM
jgi:hypothetical protein